MKPTCFMVLPNTDNLNFLRLASNQAGQVKKQHLDNTSILFQFLRWNACLISTRSSSKS